MKTFLIRSRSNFLILLSLVAAPAWARPVAQVTEVKGQAFVVTAEGKTKGLKANDHLEEKSEVMVEEGGVVTLNDYYDATYHLVGGSHLKIFNKSVQLKRGKTWIQSANARHALALTTANGHVDFWKSEFIVTFDQANSRSQILVVNGDVEVSNVLDRQVKQAIPAGSFTLVDPEVENGVPRAPTKVGLASLNTALAEFKQLPAKMKAAGTEPARGIASVTTEGSAVKKGEITFISTNRLPASVKGQAHAYFKKAASTKRPVLTSAPIRFYGMNPPALTEVPRSPASVPTPALVPQKAGEKVSLDPEFSESLKQQQIQQPKYSKELDSLIQDLKSY